MDSATRTDFTVRFEPIHSTGTEAQLNQHTGTGCVSKLTSGKLITIH
jgi:hypothetical protein